MSAENMERYPSSGIDVLIVGGGMGGLTSAIECHRKGHNVRVLEKRDEFSVFGDLIGLGRNAQRSMLKWPGFLPRLMSWSLPSALEFYKYDGELLVKLDDKDNQQEGINSAPTWRSLLHELLAQYTSELGITIEFGKAAVEYHETDSKGFVNTADGTTYEADVVIAADGISSRSANLILRHQEKPTSSGYAIYRTTIPLDHALKDPDVATFWGDESFDGVRVFLGHNVHIITAKSSKTNKITYMMTHKDVDKSATEAWSANCAASDALPFVPESGGWPEYVRGLIRQTPENKVVNWSLMWRSPQPTWMPPKGRVVQLGDACHPFLPTSGNGAAMAMEDSYSLAACLQIGGKKNIPLAVRVHHKLRFERVSSAQKMGFDTREAYHHPDWDHFKSHPETVGVVYPWVLEHDSEQYAIDNFEAVAKHITEGTPFENTNGPPDVEYEPWTVASLLEEAEKNRAKDTERMAAEKIAVAAKMVAGHVETA